MNVCFKFNPLDRVSIDSLGLIYEGRVQRCIQDVGHKSYEVEYSADGQFVRREFYEDELISLNEEEGK